MAKRSSFNCPNCGEEVPAGARACPECGADEKTGWSETTRYDGTDIPDDEGFDYDRFLEKEGLARPKRSRRRFLWLVVTVLLLVALALLYLLCR